MKRYALPLKILLGFISILAVAATLLAWRLSIGPIALDWAGNYLKQAISTNERQINFRDARLIWQSDEDQTYEQNSGLQVIFYDLQIVDSLTDFTLNIPEAGVNFSGLAMMRGLLAPTDVQFSGLSIDYILPPDIWQSTDKRPLAEKLQEFIKNIQNTLLFDTARGLLSAPESLVAAGYLRQISLLDTKITISDQASGQKWLIPSAHLNLQRTEEGLNARLFGDILEEGANVTPINLMLSFNNKQQIAVINLKFSELIPSVFAGKVEALSGLSTFDIAVQGDVSFTIDRILYVPIITFNMALDKGVINPGKIYSVPLNISSAALAGHINTSENTVNLSDISLRLGQTFLSGSGLLYGTFAKPGIAIKAQVADLPFVDLKKYWPGQFGKGAYNWIAKNIDAGIVPEGQLDIQIKPHMWPDGESGDLPKEVVNFKFNFKDITAHYLRPMPILTGLSGEAELNLHEFRLRANKGNIDNLAVSNAHLLFSNIHIKGSGLADITLELKGSLEEILRVIDHKPLGYPTKYGIKQGSITGIGNATLSLKFPLLRKVRLKDVIFDVKARINDLSIPELTETLRIDDGQLQLHVDGSGIKGEGNISLNGVDMAATWLEKFSDAQEFPTSYVVNGFIEGAQWEDLNLPFDPYIDGPVEIDLTLYGKGGAIRKGHGAFNLLNSNSMFAPIGWNKPKGKAAQVSFDLTFPHKDHVNITDIVLQSESLRADLELDLVDDWVTRFFIPKLIMPDTDIVMLMEWSAEKKYYLSSITGNSFNAAPLIEILMATGGEEKVNLPDFNLEANVDNLLTKNNIYVKNINLNTIYREQDFTHVTLKGELPEDKEINVSVSPDGDSRKLTFTSNDAGRALRGLGMFNLGIGGDMALTADMIKHEHGISLGGKAKITKFKVINSPGFSKLLSEKKFEKVKEELDKGGLSFNDFEMNFRTYNGVLEIDKGRARGPTLGIMMDGTVDQAYDELSLSGTLVPAYGINSLLSNIPLIGTILTGGKGQGVFAATYKVTGPLDNPEVKINPLSVLTPGILRSIFGAMGGKKETMREKAEKLQEIIPNTPPVKESIPEE